MKYIENNMMPGEVLIDRATVHWAHLLPSVIILVLGTLGTFFQPIIGIVVVIIGGGMFIGQFLYHISTELAVTSSRVVAKFGFIRRSTIELNHRTVESFRVEQSLLGRLFDYGTVFINGTGGISTPIPNISKPLNFRRLALNAMELDSEIKS